MTMMRPVLSLFAVAALAGCSLLHLGSSAHGVSVVGKTEYCGTPSQASEVHYFSDPDAFGNWINYRDVNGFNAGMAKNGILVVGMGQRPTGGYHLRLEGKHTGIKNGVLNITFDWHAPRLDAAVSQALTSECLAVKLPKGSYKTVKVRDQLGNVRGVVHPDS